MFVNNLLRLAKLTRFRSFKTLLQSRTGPMPASGPKPGYFNASLTGPDRPSRCTSNGVDAVEQPWREEDYLSLYPDVRRAIARGDLSSGLAHWRAHGQAEGRINPATEDLPNVSTWDEQGYLYLYPDVETAVRNGDFPSAFAHYVLQGRREKRRLPHAYGPDWLVKEMKEISAIEPALHPSPRLFATSSDHKPQGRRPLGHCVHEALRLVVGQNFSHVFLLPWLRRGGADLGALHHISALSKNGMNGILVITTEDMPSTWLHRLPPGVHYIDLGTLMRKLDSVEEKIYVLTRLLLAIQADTVHIINSNLGWKTVA
ncbi:MAG: hypothetical protein EOO38_14865, partial [Cytophagaceae bacterium]